MTSNSNFNQIQIIDARDFFFRSFLINFNYKSCFGIIFSIYFPLVPPKLLPSCVLVFRCQSRAFGPRRSLIGDLFEFCCHLWGFVEFDDIFECEEADLDGD
jgi:hypothetical protein